LIVPGYFSAHVAGRIIWILTTFELAITTTKMMRKTRETHITRQKKKNK